VTADRIDLLAMCRVKGVPWNFLAREAQRPGGMARLVVGEAPSEESREAREWTALLPSVRAELPRHRETVEQVVSTAEAEGYRLTTVLDQDYPANLRVIYNLPPFLFYRGELRSDDAYSVAVVGTRRPTDEGVVRARRMSRLLVDAGVTVLSGLARGIDTAAHEACLSAGGRTIAVLGSGIRRIYPPESVDLADRIAETGAVVSQFWPDAPPTSYNFPRRNVVMSGMGQGTVVIEASATSGAKMQARLAIEHGKQVFLVTSLVTDREWARSYLKRPRVYEVKKVDDILKHLRSSTDVEARAEQRLQLALSLG
jgi:DNA processing protein